jgi:hypothetical protein
MILDFESNIPAIYSAPPTLIIGAKSSQLKLGDG